MEFHVNAQVSGKKKESVEEAFQVFVNAIGKATKEPVSAKANTGGGINQFFTEDKEKALKAQLQATEKGRE